MCCLCVVFLGTLLKNFLGNRLHLSKLRFSVWPVVFLCTFLLDLWLRAVEVFSLHLVVRKSILCSPMLWRTICRLTRDLFPLHSSFCVFTCYTPCLSGVWFYACPFASSWFCFSLLLLISPLSRQFAIFGTTSLGVPPFLSPGIFGAVARLAAQCLLKASMDLFSKLFYATWSLSRPIFCALQSMQSCQKNAKPLFLSKRVCLTQVCTQAMRGVYDKFLSSIFNF